MLKQCLVNIIHTNERACVGSMSKLRRDASTPRTGADASPLRTFYTLDMFHWWLTAMTMRN